MDIDEKVAETKYGKVGYLVLGHGKQTVLYLHGWVGRPGFAFNLASLLNEKESKYRVIAPYLPGHGSSFSLTKTFNFDDLVAVMAEFNQEVCPENTIVIGHSLGGALAWELANRPGSRVKKLVIVSGFFKDNRMGATSIIIHWFVDRVTRRLQEGRISFSTKRRSYLTKPPRLWPREIWRVVKTSKISRRDFSTTYATLCLWGESDRLAPLSSWLAVSGTRNDEVKMFPGGHYWYLGHRNELGSAVKYFLEN